jgi:hypothetical protein
MDDRGETFGRIDASLDRLMRTLVIGFIVMSSIWSAGCAATITLILAHH